MNRNSRLVNKSSKLSVQRRPGSAEDLAFRGSKLAVDGKYQDAIPLLESAVELDPKRASAWFNLGVCRQGLGDLLDAWQAYERCAELKPDDAEAHNNLGLIALQHKAFDRARRELLLALELAPTPLIRRNLARLTAEEESDSARTLVCAGLPDPKPGTKQPTISACLIVRNEEANLRKCLESVKDFVDEMLVIDTGSTDRTVEIALELGAKVHFFEWTNDFSAARNELLKHTASDWMLVLDGDFWLEREEALKVRRAVASGMADFYYYSVNSQGAGGTGMGTANVLPFLFRKLPGLRWEGAVHEQITPSMARLGLSSAYTDIEVMHSGYEDLETLRRKALRNLECLESDQAAGHDTPHLHLHLAQTYMVLGRYDEAIEKLESLIKTDLPVQTGRAYIYLMLGSAYYSVGRYKEALRFAESAAAVSPGMRALWRVAAQAALRTGKPELGLKYAREALKVRDSARQVQLTNTVSDCVLRALMGDCYVAMGDMDSALAEYTLAWHDAPSKANIGLVVSKAFLQLDRLEDGVAGLKQVLAHNPGHEVATRLLAEAYCALGGEALHSGDIEKAFELYASAVETAPSDPEGYRGVAGVLMRLGREEDAEVCWVRAEQLASGLS